METRWPRVLPCIAEGSREERKGPLPLPLPLGWPTPTNSLRFRLTNFKIQITNFSVLPQEI